MSRPDIPYPIIFGSRAPQLRLELVRGSQLLYSRNNYHLYLRAKDFRDGSFPISLLVQQGTRTGSLRHKGQLEAQYDISSCCSESEPCPMIIDKCEEHPFHHEVTGEEVMVKAVVVLRDMIDLSMCPVIGRLIAECQSPAEKKFATTYYKWAITDFHYNPNRQGPLGTTVRFEPFLEAWHNRQFQLAPYLRRPNAVSAAIVESFTAPALIPQDWLNWVYDPNRSPDEEEQTSLRDMPSRVDFVLVKDGERHVVEIDDPSHYASFDDRARRYEVDEKRYTRNLRIERKLREHGWQIHRFSNWEVLDEDEEDLISIAQSELGIPKFGHVAPRMDGIPDYEAEDLPF